MLDYVIRSGTVIDGTGGPARELADGALIPIRTAASCAAASAGSCLPPCTA